MATWHLTILPRTSNRKPLIWSSTLTKPAVANLLATAVFVKVDDQISGFRLEVRGRIVKCQVAILSDTGKSNINRRRTHGLAHTAGNFRGIAVAVQEVILHNPRFRY